MAGLPLAQALGGGGAAAEDLLASAVSGWRGSRLDGADLPTLGVCCCPAASCVPWWLSNTSWRLVSVEETRQTCVSDLDPSLPVEDAIVLKRTRQRSLASGPKLPLGVPRVQGEMAWLCEGRRGVAPTRYNVWPGEPAPSALTRTELWAPEVPPVTHARDWQSGIPTQQRGKPKANGGRWQYLK